MYHMSVRIDDQCSSDHHQSDLSSPWKSMKKSLAFLLLLSLSSCIAEDHSEELECSVYLAESSVKNGGWGVFAGKDYALGDRIGYAGVGVQVLESHELREEFLSKFLT